MQFFKRKITSLWYSFIKEEPILPLGSFASSLKILRSNGFEPEVIWDVGANVGMWSVMANKCFNSSQFYLFEPQRELVGSLKRLEENNKNFNFMPYGLGQNDEQRVLTKWEDTYGSSFLPSPKESLLNVNKQELLPLRSINSLIENDHLQFPNMVKLDVQGYELEVLKGASCILGQTEVFIIELSLFTFDDVPGQPEIFEVIQFMNGFDYVIYDFSEFLRRPYDDALGQCDVIFVRKDSFLRKNKGWT